MRVAKAIGLAAVLLAPQLVSVASAQNAPECPIAGTLSTFRKSIRRASSTSRPGEPACFPLRIEGVIAASSIVQKTRLRSA